MTSEGKPVKARERQGEGELSLARKLVEVAQAISGVEKSGRNDFHKYDYAKAEDVLRLVRKELLDRGVRLGSMVSKVDVVDGVTHVYMYYWFIDSENDYQSDPIQWIGTGIDKGDKAVYKAYTGALKYFLVNQFQIPFGDDAEGDVETDREAEKKPAEPPRLKKADLLKVEAALNELPEGRAQMILGAVGVDAAADLRQSHLPELRRLVTKEKKVAA